MDKAAKMAERIAALNEIEGYWARAKIAEKRKEFPGAEQQLRRAVELAPAQVGRLLDLAKFLAKQGRFQESDQTFQAAEKMAPDSPKVMFAKADTYIKQRPQPGHRAQAAATVSHRHADARRSAARAGRKAAEASGKLILHVSRRIPEIQRAGAARQSRPLRADRAGHGDRHRLGDPGGHHLAHQPRLHPGADSRASAPTSSSPTTLAGGQASVKADADFVKVADVEAVRQQLGDRIVAATGVMTNYDRMVIGNREEDIKVNGADQYYQTVRNLVITSGSFFDASDITLRTKAALLTEKLAERLYGSRLTALGRIIKIHGLQFTVIGTFKEKVSTFGQSELDADTILIPMTRAALFRRRGAHRSDVRAGALAAGRGLGGRAW